MGFPNLILYAIPVFLLSMYLEYRLNKDDRAGRYEKQDFTTNIIIGIGDILLALAISSFVSGVLYLGYALAEDLRFSFFGYHSLGWSIWVWLIAIVLDDFTYYWFHRTSHRIRILWACHIVHHNSEHFNFSTAIRNSWVGVLYKPLYWIWLAVLGFHPLMILTCMSINACYQFFCHTQVFPAWDKLSWILTTPGLHAIHHGKDSFCIDKNYAGTFIFIDRLFGTHQPIDPERKVTFGVTHPPRSQHFWEITVHEFRDIYQSITKAKTFADKIRCMINSPGWKPPAAKTQKLKPITMERSGQLDAAA